MGFLDAFDNPDIMSAILGMPPTMITGNSAPPAAPIASAPSAAAVPLPRPRPDVPASVPLPPPRPDVPAPGAPGTNALDMVPPSPGPSLPSGRGPVDLASPEPAAPATRPSGPISVPVGPQPGSLDSLSLGMAANAPLSLSAPPATATGNQLYGDVAPNFLTRAFGLDAQQQDQLRAALMGLGKGLSAVGQLRPGAPAGQAFAAGMGGALQGSAALEE